MLLTVEPDGDDPIYQQLRDQIVVAIAEGELVPGDALPTTRQLAADLGINMQSLTAQRMVGAINHPLNQAIIDPQDNIVVAGYGILQPRVDISVDSTARSRLAAIFVGETGLDPYTRASSDVYQDLYGEGSFTGKGSTRSTRC